MSGYLTLRKFGNEKQLHFLASDRIHVQRAHQHDFPRGSVVGCPSNLLLPLLWKLSTAAGGCAVSPSNTFVFAELAAEEKSRLEDGLRFFGEDECEPCPAQHCPSVCWVQHVGTMLTRHHVDADGTS